MGSLSEAIILSRFATCKVIALVAFSVPPDKGILLNAPSDASSIAANALTGIFKIKMLRISIKDSPLLMNIFCNIFVFISISPPGSYVGHIRVYIAQLCKYYTSLITFGQLQIYNLGLVLPINNSLCYQPCNG